MSDGMYTWEDLTADVNELIVAGLVAVTGEWPDERFVITAEGERQLELWRLQVRSEARQLAERRETAQQLGLVVPILGA